MSVACVTGASELFSQRSLGRIVRQATPGALRNDVNAPSA